MPKTASFDEYLKFVANSCDISRSFSTQFECWDSPWCYAQLSKLLVSGNTSLFYIRKCSQVVEVPSNCEINLVPIPNSADVEHNFKM